MKMFAAGQNYYEAANAEFNAMRSTIHDQGQRISQMPPAGKLFEDKTSALTLENENLKRTDEMDRKTFQNLEVHVSN